VRPLRLGGLAILVTVLLTAPAAAAQPTITTEVVEASFTDQFLSEVCGFPVTVTASGHTRTRHWSDAGGAPIRELFTVNVHVTISAGGASMRTLDSGMDKVTFLDGGAAQVEIHGNLQLLTVKGHGPVLGAAGRFAFIETPLFDENGDPILDEDGNQVVDFELLADSGIRAEEDLEAVCAALAPAQ
jgi:hypothetical protein